MQFKFSLFKIPFIVGIEFFLLAVLLAANRISQPSRILIWVGVVFLSIIIHELGHAFSFRIFGYSPRIRLHSFGGETSISGENHLKPWQDIVVGLAGPLSGILCGGSLYLIYLFLPQSVILNDIMNDVIRVNIGWSIINLFPLYPLDGGQITKTVIASIFKKRGELIFYIFSMTIALGLAMLSLYYQSYWIALVTGFLFIQNIQTFRYMRTIGKDSALNPEIRQVYALLEQNKNEEARSKALALYEQAQSLPVKNLALNLCAWSFFKQDEIEQALATLDRHTDPRQKDQRLYAILLYKTERFPEAKLVLFELFSRHQEEELAWMLFNTLERLKDFDALYSTIMRYPGSQLSKELYITIASFFHRNGRFNESFEVSSLLFNKMKVPEAACNAARSKCRLNDRKSALKWLGKAVKNGFQDALAFEKDPDLECLKDEEGFKDLYKIIQLRAETPRH
jgi:Zn-dependent protease